MTLSGEGRALLQAQHGFAVARATGVVNADVDLFSIDGGRVFLFGILGTVTTAIGGGSQDVGLLLDPDDGGSDVVLGDTATPLAIDAAPVDSFITLGATIGADMVLRTDVAQPFLHSPIMCQPGDLRLDVTGTEAGSVQWTAWWLPHPLDTGATLVAV